MLIDSDYGSINLNFSAHKEGHDPTIGLSIVYEEPSYSMGNPFDMYLWDHQTTIMSLSILQKTLT